MYKYTLILLAFSVNAGPYIEVGLGVPLTPDTGYIPDSYGVAAVGYVHHVDTMASIDIGLVHRSLTGSDEGECSLERCYGDNAVEAKLRFEW